MMSTSDSCKDSVCDVNNISTADKDDDNIVSVCANCSKGEEESSKLKNCTACKLVKYCSRECQIAHRPQHKKECKRRAAELHDEKLFKEPPPAEDCPICLLRMPSMDTGYRYYGCCGKVICGGCVYAPRYDHLGNKVNDLKCPFCRTPNPTSETEAIEMLKKRVELDDPSAILGLGNYYRDGTNGYQQDHTKALELYHRAGELGYSAAYNSIGWAHDNGEGVEVDKKMANHYWELSAMGGDVNARYHLGYKELIVGNFERALKHFFIGAKSGKNNPLEMTQKMYKNGHATKEDYTRALQSYQEYLGEIKSDQRDKAAGADDEYRYY